ncbi:MAG TPA: hypothetical protein VGD41_08630, partial [Pyrinomonadaceae bacterium]
TVIHRVIAHQPIQIDGRRFTVERMRGWYEIVFRESKTGTRRVFNLDDLVRLTRRKKRVTKKPLVRKPNAKKGLSKKPAKGPRARART